MNPSEHETLYEVLGLGCDASHDEIRRAYFRLAKRYHPDLNPEADDSNRQFKRVRHAYEILSDPVSRNAYDRRPGRFSVDDTASGYGPVVAPRPGPYRDPATGMAGGSHFPFGKVGPIAPRRPRAWQLSLGSGILAASILILLAVIMLQEDASRRARTTPTKMTSPRATAGNRSTAKRLASPDGVRGLASKKLSDVSAEHGSLASRPDTQADARSLGTFPLDRFSTTDPSSTNAASAGTSFADLDLDLETNLGLDLDLDMDLDLMDPSVTREGLTKLGGVELRDFTVDRLASPPESAAPYWTPPPRPTAPSAVWQPIAADLPLGDKSAVHRAESGTERWARDQLARRFESLWESRAVLSGMGSSGMGSFRTRLPGAAPFPTQSVPATGFRPAGGRSYGSAQTGPGYSAGPTAAAGMARSWANQAAAAQGTDYSFGRSGQFAGNSGSDGFYSSRSASPTDPLAGVLPGYRPQVLLSGAKREAGAFAPPAAAAPRSRLPAGRSYRSSYGRNVSPEY